MRMSEAIVTVMLAALAGSVPAAARPMSTTDGDLSVAFVVEDGSPQLGRGGDQARVDVGDVAATWRRNGFGRRASAASTLIQRRVGVRVTSRTGRRGFVRLRASLPITDGRAIASVDGLVLTAAPRLIDAQAPIGSIVGHLVAIQLPASAPAGAFSSEILWEVEEP
jgi:hypothetical protein